GPRAGPRTCRRAAARPGPSRRPMRWPAPAAPGRWRPGFGQGDGARLRGLWPSWIPGRTGDVRQPGQRRKHAAADAAPGARRRRQAVRLRLVAHRGRRRVPLHRLDPAVARIRGVVLLAGADDLVVAGPQVEHVLPARRLLPLVAGVVRRVPADRLDPVRAARLVLVALAGEDHLPIAGAQPEPEFPRLVLEDLELACHACPPVGSLGTGRAQRLPGTPAA